MDSMGMDEKTAARLRRALTHINPQSTYYALTFTATDDGQLEWSMQSGYVGAGSKPFWELRAPVPVNPGVMRELWIDIGQTCICVNDNEALFFFLRAGGNALVEE